MCPVMNGNELCHRGKGIRKRGVPPSFFVRPARPFLHAPADEDPVPSPTCWSRTMSGPPLVSGKSSAGKLETMVWTWVVPRYPRGEKRKQSHLFSMVYTQQSMGKTPLAAWSKGIVATNSSFTRFELQSRIIRVIAVSGLWGRSFWKPESYKDWGLVKSTKYSIYSQRTPTITCKNQESCG